MKKSGSILIIVVILLAAAQMMALIYFGVLRTFRRSAEHTRQADIALYNANAGINSVMNILMRDADWDFRTAGMKSPGAGFADTVPYSFDFETADFKIEVLNENNNPITDMLGTSEPMFNTQKHSIWIKATGFFYQGGAERYINHISGGGTVADFPGRIMKRTIISRLRGRGDLPLDPFAHAILTCGQLSRDGVGTPESGVYGPVCASSYGGGSLNKIYDGIDCILSKDECDALEENLPSYFEGLCTEGTTWSDTLVTMGPGWEGLNADGKVEGINCLEGNLSFTGNVESVTPVDSTGDGTYSHEGDVPPPILIVKGSVDMTGTSNFNGIIIAISTDCDNVNHKIAGTPDDGGSIITFCDTEVLGTATITHHSYGGYLMGLSNRNKIQSRAWATADKAIRTEYPQGSSSFLNITISHLDPPDSVEWE